MAFVVNTEEEKVDLGGGKYQILTVETLDNGNVRKTDSGFKEVAGVKVKKEYIASAAPTKLSDIDLNKDLDDIIRDFILKEVAKDLIAKAAV